VHTTLTRVPFLAGTDTTRFVPGGLAQRLGAWAAGVRCDPHCEPAVRSSEPVNWVCVNYKGRVAPPGYT
jgi:hypothetical protein